MFWIIVGSFGFIAMLIGLYFRLQRKSPDKNISENEELAALIVPWFGS